LVKAVSVSGFFVSTSDPRRFFANQLMGRRHAAPCEKLRLFISSSLPDARNWTADT
jgi:hypothetical protein